jgi:WD40 repeat protein/serine/threonine protein kinase
MAIDFQHVQSVFQAVGELPLAKRAAALERECGDDAELRRCVEALLQAHDDSGELPVVNPERTGAYEPAVEPSQVFAGRYKLRQKLGEGGMGVVFVADQTEPVQRRVALKIIRAGPDSHRLLARFEQERQALAVMDHPNIAKVFDAGVDSPLAPSGGEASGVRAFGQPYFAMELVKGLPLTRFCDDAKLSPRQRLELFIPVCQAVQHAHQKGIIHRDLKPSNILVGLYDGRPVPKVIDFGVAKATGPRLTQQSVYTEVGSIIGTLEYMSPEQAELNNLDIDTRSDIYALGVILYELLTGAVPFSRKELEKAGLAEMLRVIKEVEPAKPSTKLSHSGTLPSIAAQRQMEPRKLTALVRGELDWIVMKAMAKERDRRYETANGFAKDIERFLNHEPVTAGPPTMAYRLRKFVRRNRGSVFAASLVLLALAAGLIGTTVEMLQANRAAEAERQATKDALKQKELAEQRKREADLAKDDAVQQRDELRRLNYVADMNLAQHAWEGNNLGRTRQLLERHRPKPGEDDLRGFEWHYLERLFHRALLTINAHAGPISTVVFSPDGRRLYSSGRARPLDAIQQASRPGEIKLWDAATGQPMDLTLDGLSDSVRQIALSADGTYLAAACGLKGIQVWNLATRQRFDLETLPNKRTFAVGFSPDSKRLLAALAPVDLSQNLEDAVRVFDLASRHPVWTLDRLPALNPSMGPAFSSDGKYLALAHFVEGFVCVVDTATGREAFNYKDGEAKMNQAIFSPDGKSLAVSGELGATIWDVATHRKRLTCRSSVPYGSCLAYSPDSKQLARANMGGQIELWDAGTGQPINSFKGHAGDVYTIAFSPDGKRLASAGDDGTVRLWDTTRRADVVPILDESKRLGVLDLSPDGHSLLAGERGTVEFDRGYLVDPTTGQRRGKPIQLDERAYRSFDWTADGKRLIGPGTGKTIWIYDTGTGALVRSIPVDRESECITAISPDGQWFAHSAPAASIKIRDAQTGAERRSLCGLTGRVYNLAISSEGSRLAGANAQGWVKVWDAATGRECMSIQIRDMYLSHMRFSPDGKRLAIVGNNRRISNGEARILDVATGREILQLAGHTALVMDVSFSPDGQRLATCSFDRTIRLWDARTGQQTLTLSGHTLQINSVRFLAGGQQLISASVDQTIRLWDSTPLERK